MAQLCTNAPPITNSALNGSHLHECLFTHSECTQPTQMKCSAYTLKMHSTNSNQVLPLHTQNALNQLKSRALLTHSECTQPTQMKCSPYTLTMHSTNSNQDLQCWNVDTCTSMLRNTSKEHQSSLCAPPNSRWLPKFFKTRPRLQKRLQEPSRTETCTSNTHNLKISLNAHKQSNL